MLIVVLSGASPLSRQLDKVEPHSRLIERSDRIAIVRSKDEQPGSVIVVINKDQSC